MANLMWHRIKEEQVSSKSSEKTGEENKHVSSAYYVQGMYCTRHLAHIISFHKSPLRQVFISILQMKNGGSSRSSNCQDNPMAGMELQPRFIQLENLCFLPQPFGRKQVGPTSARGPSIFFLLITHFIYLSSPWYYTEERVKPTVRKRKFPVKLKHMLWL